MNKENLGILTQLNTFRSARPGPFWASTGVALLSMFGMVAAFGTAPGTTIEAPLLQQTVIEQLAPALSLASQPETEFFVHEERIQRGDSIAGLLARLGVQDGEAFQLLRSHPAGQKIFRQLRPGKNVTAHVTRSGELLALIYPLNGMDRVLVVNKRDGHLSIQEQSITLESQVQLKSGEIQTSLFGATDDAGIPDSIALQMADIFGSDVDFHRGLRRGDHFSVVYETLSYLGKPVRSGRILAAEFTNDGKSHRAVWYEDSPGKGSYYTPEGKSLRRGFLRSPLEFSRITSGFTTARFHPILQTWRAHKGVDYGAPTGTRVKATSDGTVDFVGNQGGYGRVVILRHQGRYTTLYGHLSGFAAGLHKGGHVTQGDVIGYVGSSGWATGPHLHYEFRINDVHQNPLAISLPAAAPLTVAQMDTFRKKTHASLAQLALIKASPLAALD
ncbi:MAG: M23 family metallopeptidase [Sterolibacterium sp.]|nr:M23 family metallopeptidase [Sterolibacterium sp.]MBP9799716.1 M23 family metallopeptidase [Sterolibacterium sp.]